MKKMVAEREPSSLVDLKNKILVVWVFQTFPETLSRSMSRGIAAVIANKGYPTKYGGAPL